MPVSGFFGLGKLGSRSKKSGTSNAKTLILASGSYVVNGFATALVWSGGALSLPLTTGAYSISGNAATLALSGASTSGQPMGLLLTLTYP